MRRTFLRNWDAYLITGMRQGESEVVLPEHNMPYMHAYGNINKALNGISRAQTPDRFTQDFLETKLGQKGGSARPVIPFLKKTGFLNSDGSPTSLYKEFRNPSLAGAAAARALKAGFAELYAINEYVHDLSDPELKGIIVQATGSSEDSGVVKSIAGSFKALRGFANFDVPERVDDLPQAADNVEAPTVGAPVMPSGLALGYTINLHLPATSDVAVYNAIFKSLRDHIL